MAEHVLTFNVGSSSVKFALFAVDRAWPPLCASGQVEGLTAAPRFQAHIVDGETFDAPSAAKNHEEALNSILDWINATFSDALIAAIGHRVVHGGLAFMIPVIVDNDILAQLQTFAPLAPLHQPHNIAGIEAARRTFPNVPHVACFDTAFHRGHSFVNDAYALPRSYYERGLRRFGFHGLSYEYIARQLKTIDSTCAQGRVIVAHLGNGASLCAMMNGRSVASTMGFSALEGLPMGTRCGQIDPGLLLHLIEHDRISTADLTRLLYEQSGLKGLSGVTSDMRTLESSCAPEAQQAIDYFVHRLRIEIGAMAATLSGVDALVFTGGIGENSVRVRASALVAMDWLGFNLDPAANERNEMIISNETSAAKIYVIPTDEQAMIAYHAIDTIGLAPAKATVKG